jgi:hypothetical protein
MHIYSQRGKFKTYEPTDVKIQGLLGQVEAFGKGTYEIALTTPNGPVTLLLHDVYHVPGLPYNLFSTSSARNSVWFDTKMQALRRWSDDSVLTKTTLYEGLYCLTASTTPREPLVTESKQILDARLWHYRLGHAGARTLQDTLRCTTGCNIPSKIFDKLPPCSICLQNKSKQQISRRQMPPVQAFGDRLHVDLCGLIKPPSFDGFSYYMSVIDDFTRYR